MKYKFTTMKYKSTLLKGFLGICIAGGLLIASSETSAVPAKPGKIEYTMPNGETISVYLRGDESAHYYISEDGHALSRGEDGYFRYISIEENGLNKVSDVIANNQNKRNSQETLFLKSLNKEAILKNAPRSLKDPVSCKFSAFKRKSQSSVKPLLSIISV